MNTKLDTLKKVFNKKELYTQALTHRSWVNEHKGERTSNERLEFLGDAVLEYVVSKELYKAFPDKEEGYLTALRASLVNTISLSEVAINLDLGSELFLSKGEEDGGGRANISLLADTVEAIIGALFIDTGLPPAEKFIDENLLFDLAERARLPLKDAKSQLQELAQSKGFQAPRYQVASEEGPDHSKKFVIEVYIDGKSVGKGEGKSKSTAEQEAAKDALVHALNEKI